MCGSRQFVDHFSSSSKLDYYEWLNHCREKTNPAVEVTIETNVEEGMVFRMPSGKYQSFRENLEIFHLS